MQEDSRITLPSVRSEPHHVVLLQEITGVMRGVTVSAFFFPLSPFFSFFFLYLEATKTETNKQTNKRSMCTRKLLSPEDVGKPDG